MSQDHIPILNVFHNPNAVITAALDEGYKGFDPDPSGAFVALPDCEEVENVLFCGQEIPQFEVTSFPKSNIENLTEQQETRLALWTLDKSGPVPVLRRSIFSNNGIWQAKPTKSGDVVEQVYVKGKFKSKSKSKAEDEASVGAK